MRGERLVLAMSVWAVFGPTTAMAQPEDDSAELDDAAAAAVRAAFAAETQVVPDSGTTQDEDISSSNTAGDSASGTTPEDGGSPAEPVHSADTDASGEDPVAEEAIQDLESLQLGDLLGNTDDDGGTVDDGGSSSSADRFARETASGAYGGPTLQFFALHGYATLVLAAADDSFGGAPQILLPGVGPGGLNDGGFAADSAIFIGTDASLDVSAIVETHFIGTGFDPVVTEAKVTWQVWKLWEDDLPEFTLRLIGGRFWWPFGDHNREWFSSVNTFNVISPAATLAVPPHHNETGAMIAGEAAFSDNVGLNYAVALGNGPRGFLLSDNVPAGPFDFDGGRTFTARLELVVGNIFRTGFSIAQGLLRNGDGSLDATNPNAYEASFLALGPHVRLDVEGLTLRSYLYWSKESLEAAPKEDLVHWGVNSEAFYVLPLEIGFLREVGPKVRFSYGSAQQVAGAAQRESQIAFGVNVVPHEQLLLKVEYVLNRGPGVFENRNADVFSASMTGSF